MRIPIGYIALFSLTGLLSASSALAQPGPGGPSWGGAPYHGWNTNRMQERKEMREERQKVMQEMKTLDADFSKKVAEMNQAQGNAKVDAIAAALNVLAQEHQVLHQRMQELQARVRSHRHGIPDAVGGSQNVPGGSTSGSSGTGHEPKWTPGQ